LIARGEDRASTVGGNHYPKDWGVYAGEGRPSPRESAFISEKKKRGAASVTKGKTFTLREKGHLFTLLGG